MLHSLLPAFALLCLQSTPPADPGTSHLIRVRLDSQPQAHALLEHAGLLSCLGERQEGGRRFVDIVVAHEEMPAWRALGLVGTELDRGRPFKDIVAEQQKPGPMVIDANYFTVPEIEAELAKLATTYPTLARKVDITAFTGSPKTHESRSLYALVISDNVTKDEDEPRVLMASQHHARELNSPYMNIGAARRLLSGYATNAAIKQVVDENEIWIVPTVNPDGVAYVWSTDNYWRKNRRKNSATSYGVDLNRNYPYQWGQCGSSSSSYTSSVYRGPSAGSEPEVQTMMALARKLRFERYLDFHSYGREVLWTYHSCVQSGYASTAWGAVESHHRQILMTAASFQSRSPSASGEAQEFHASENGSLAYLVEIGTSFQPAWASTVSEEARVWPLILRFLQMKPAIRAHVRSLKGQGPLAASSGRKFPGTTRGASFRRRADAAGLHLWGLPGKPTVPGASSGHVTGSFGVLATGYEAGSSFDLDRVPTLPAATLTAPATATLGTPTAIDFAAGDPGKSYWIAMALGSTPGFAVPPRTIPLNPDAIFFLSYQPLAPIFTGQIGTLDASGKAQAKIDFPRQAIFNGLKLWFCGLTFESGWPLGVKAISPARPVQLKL